MPSHGSERVSPQVLATDLLHNASQFRPAFMAHGHNLEITLKATLARMLPKPVRNFVERTRLVSEFAVDGWRYWKYMAPIDTGAGPKMSPSALETQIVKDYHRVEKGMALKNPKRPFGSATFDRLTELLPMAPTDADYTAHGDSALKALGRWNSDGVLDEDIAPVSDDAVHDSSDPLTFFHTRHSVRDYSDRPVSRELLNSVVDAAISSPSVCNRQSWRIRFFDGAEKDDVLRHQNGNRGFGESVPVVALVTVDVRLFSGAGERNQAWIEGGIFSMGFVLALHAVGLDSCMLNLSLTNRSLAALRAQVGIESNELPIMMIAMGYGSEGHRRARSPRKGADEVIQGVRKGS